MNMPQRAKLSAFAGLGALTMQLIIPGLQITLDFNRSWAMLLTIVLCTGVFGAMLAHHVVNVCRGRFMGSIDLYENGVVIVPRLRLTS